MPHYLKNLIAQTIYGSGPAKLMDVNSETIKKYKIITIVTQWQPRRVSKWAQQLDVGHVAINNNVKSNDNNFYS